MEFGYKKAKGLRSTDSSKSVNFEKRPEGPTKIMGYPCSLEINTPASRPSSKKNVPTDLDPRTGLFFDLPKTRVY